MVWLITKRHTEQATELGLSFVTINESPDSSCPDLATALRAVVPRRKLRIREGPGPHADACVRAVQCGDFYESVGTDAVILVQFAGLNAMGSKSPPRAGCPKQNIRKVLTDLVDEAGLTVVRCLHSILNSIDA